MAKGSEDRRIAVLEALRGSPGGVSGEALASQLGVSRVAIRKHVAALQEMGYIVDARPGEGYRLVAVPDAPLPFEVSPLLETSFYARVEGKVTTGSTNDDARALALAGAENGTVVLAREQTAGRGRLGRTWASPPGGVYASVVLRPDVETPEAVMLPLVVGIGVRRALAVLGVDSRLKWPNDVLAPDGRKLAGVLCEGLSEGWHIAWVIAGVGLNVRHAPDESPGACVDEFLDAPVPLARAAAALLDGIASAYEVWCSHGFDPLCAEYEGALAILHRDVVVTDSHGRTLADGTVAGIDGGGRLLVRTADGIVPILAGDVTLRREAGGA